MDVIEARPAEGATRLPFAYQYVDSSPLDRSPPPRIILVMGPGVTMHMHNFHPDDTNYGLTPALDVFRVQDLKLVPPLGFDIETAGFTPGYSTGMLPMRGTNSDRFPTDYFVVNLERDGVTISHPFTVSRFLVRVKLATMDSGNQDDALDRFAFWFEPPKADDLIPVHPVLTSPLLVVVSTPSVECTIERALYHLIKPNNPYQTIDYWRVVHVPTIDDVPPQGTNLIDLKGEDATYKIKRQGLPSDTAVELGIDLMLSIWAPIAIASSIAEFSYGVVKRQNKWGRPIDTEDLVILGLNAALAVIPVLVRGAMFATKILQQRFGDKARLVRELAIALKDAAPTQRELDAVAKAATDIQKGIPVADSLLADARALLGRTQPKYPPLERYLNADGSNFQHAQLAEAYTAYVAQQAKAIGPVVSPAAWARSVTRGPTRDLLEAMCGRDYAKAIHYVDERLLSVMSTPRPARLTDEVLTAVERSLNVDEAKMLERVPSEAFASKDVSETLTFSIAAKNFKTLKGNIAEILSLPLQRAWLREIAKVYPDARLCSGVKMRILVGGKLKEVLFSDNVIARVLETGDIQVLGVIEVKSGYNGGLEATEQVFEWMERSIEDGVQLVLTKGAKLEAANGTVTTLSREAVFTYRGASGPQVTGLLQAPRTIMTASGVSHLGMDSAMQVSRRAIRKELAYSAEELDYITAHIFRTRIR